MGVAPSSRDLRIAPNSLFSFAIRASGHFNSTEVRIFTGAAGLGTKASGECAVAIGTGAVVRTGFIRPRPAAHVSS